MYRRPVGSIGPLQLSIHVVQKCGEEKVALGQDGQSKLPFKIMLCLLLVLPQCDFLRPNMAVLYHVNEKLQRAYWVKGLSAKRETTGPNSGC